MKLARLRQQRRAARQVYPYGQRGSASELWYAHLDLSRNAPKERRRVGFDLGQLDRAGGSGTKSRDQEEPGGE